jgi:hypothetical protein
VVAFCDHPIRCTFWSLTRRSSWSAVVCRVGFDNSLSVKRVRFEFSAVDAELDPLRRGQLPGLGPFQGLDQEPAPPFPSRPSERGKIHDGMPPDLWVPPGQRSLDRTRQGGPVTFGLTVASTAILFISLLFVVPTPVAMAAGTVEVAQRVVAQPVPPPTAAPVSTTSTPAPEPVPSPTTTLPAPVPALTTVAASTASQGLPARGHATASGCGPALAYMAAYAAPGFQLICPGDAQGHQATTCINSYPCAPGQKMILIADPCPAAYMNESSNSLAIQFGGVIDPYGACRP